MLLRSSLTTSIPHRRKRRSTLRGLIVASFVFGIAIAGEAYAQSIRVYEREHYSGVQRRYLSEEKSLKVDGNDLVIGSANVDPGRWLLCERESFTGNCAWISGHAPSFRELKMTGVIRSLRPEIVPLLRREWGERHAPSTSALALFSESNFRGDWVAVRESVRDLAAANIKIKPASIVLQKGAWRVCTQPDFHGTCLAMTASAWDMADIFTSNIASAERLY